MGIVPLYLDWQFWTAIVALLAVVLSQLPPLHLLIKPRRLEVEVYSRALVTHFVGSPNISLVLSIRNTGGRELRVKSMEMQILRDGKLATTLPAQGYFETPSAQTAVLFVPFGIRPNENWTHSVNFFSLFDRHTEKNFREKKAILQDDIAKKLQIRPQGNSDLVVADPDHVQPFMDLFHAFFVWRPGEYVITLSVKAEPPSASVAKMYRFTLFESDTAEMTEYTEGYKYGAGINYSSDRNRGVQALLSDHSG